MALRHRRCRRLALLGCWLAALTAGGCGADDEPRVTPLPRATVAELDKQLASIEDRYRFGDGACADIERDNRPSVRRTLARLPASVDRDVRRALRQSFARLFELARRQCDRHKPAPTPAVPTTPPAAAPAATATTPTDRTPTATTDTATSDSAETNPPKTRRRAPTTPKRTPKRNSTKRDKPAVRKPPDAPDTTGSGPADPGSGGTPAPQPRRRPPQR